MYLLNYMISFYNSKWYSTGDHIEKVNVLNRPENLTLDFNESDLSPMLVLKGDQKVKLESEQTNY